MLHGGKSIADIYLSEDDSYLIINRIISIIIKYCENTYMLGVQTFRDLHKEEQNKNKAFAIPRNFRENAGPDARRQEGVG